MATTCCVELHASTTPAPPPSAASMRKHELVHLHCCCFIITWFFQSMLPDLWPDDGNTCCCCQLWLRHPLRHSQASGQPANQVRQGDAPWPMRVPGLGGYLLHGLHAKNLLGGAPGLVVRHVSAKSGAHMAGLQGVELDRVRERSPWGCDCVSGGLQGGLSGGSGGVC